MNQHISQAIEQFRASAARYAKTERYYRGDHDLAFATEKFANTFGQLFREFSMNLCPAICDAVRDKLRVTGFGINAGPPAAPAHDAEGMSYAFTRDNTLLDGGSGLTGSSLETAITPKGVTLTRSIDHIWCRNRMQQRAGEIHKEALKNGDAYAIVWF